jgi:hypothetical protein
MSVSIFTRRKLASTLIILGISFLFVLATVPVVMAHPKPPVLGQLEEAQAIPLPPSELPALDFTSVATVYLPIIRRSPQPPPSAADCNPTGGSGGLKPGAYDTTVAGLKAIVVVGKDYNPKTPAHLVFYLHGDGGAYHLPQSIYNPVNQFINQQGWILVSPQAPNGWSWWANWKGDHPQALANVFNEMFARYNVCRHIVFGTTGSGGSEFWASQFFPNKGSQYPAHTIIACGGSAGNAAKLADIAKNPNVVARSTFHYVYGTADNLYPGILKSIASYKNAGFKVFTKEIQNGGHCNVWPTQGLPTWPEWAVTYWKEIAERLDVKLK